MNKLSLLSFLFLFFVFQLSGQRTRKDYIADSERFSAGFLIGLNAAQIDGDQFTGFDKRGITGGLRGIVRFTPRLDFNIEFLYSKKGSNIPLSPFVNQNNPLNHREIDLTYMDVPFFFKFMLKPKPSFWHIELGAVYSRMIQSEITEFISDPTRQFAYSSIVDEFKKSDFSALTGLGYTWKNGLSLNLRYTISINKFYVNENYVPRPPSSPAIPALEFLRNYFYSLSFSYTVFKRSSQKGKRRRP